MALINGLVGLVAWKLCKVMLKILQTRLQQYMNHELPDVQVGFRKGRGQEIKLPTSVGSSKSKRIPGKYLLLLY